MMDNQSSDDMQDAGQYPHTPGQNPQGSGEPRHLNTPDAGTGAEGGADAGADAVTADEGSPLGGDETTEEQLEADTAVDRDALKMLDPDDTPA